MRPTFERTAMAFDNPDCVDVVIHSYRHGLGLALGYPPYEEIERKLAAQPIITVSAITLDGVTSGKRWFGDGGKLPRPSDLPSGSGRRSQPAAGRSKSVCGRSREANGSRSLTP
jgi:hypothetical protein